MSSPALFPLFLKLTGKRCVVVGGTHECEQKIEGLLRAGALIEVIAEEVTDGIRDLFHRREILWERRGFRADDLEQAALVVAQHLSQEINETVFRAASERGVMCNVVDQPALCHFYYPAVVRRGDLQIAISTNGLSPALASSIRAELEERFGPLYSEWVQRLGRIRARVFRTRPRSAARTALLQRFATRSRFDRFETRRARALRGEG
jgi:precorrin-2 dehydrogenase / sirohydrochlorin ferrochelatase